MYPTFRWFILLLVCASIFFAALNYQRNPLYWLAYIICSYVVIATIMSINILKKSKWLWIKQDYNFFDETHELEEQIIKYNDDFKNKIEINYPMSVGQYSFQQNVWTTQYPFGLFKLNIDVPTKDYWVYPKPVNHFEKLQNILEKDVYEETGSYNQGDSPKRITKRTQTLEPSNWQTLKASNSVNRTKFKESIIMWDDLPNSWSFKEKIEFLSYKILNKNKNSKLIINLPNEVLTLNEEDDKQHAWKALTLLWIQQEKKI